MLRIAVPWLLLTLALAAASPSQATTIVPPRNLGELARNCRAVVLARAESSWVEDRGLPITVTRFELIETVAGGPRAAPSSSRCRGGRSANAASSSRARLASSRVAATWINELARRGITSGCGGGNYCPLGSVTRQEMAVFLLNAVEGGGYQPPACIVPQFLDVPCSHPYARWINELARRGITAGCDGGNYCPTTVVARDQIAVFLVRAFGLPFP